LAFAIVLTSGIGFAATVDSSVTTAGNAENTWEHDWWGGGSWVGWDGWSQGVQNDVDHGYSIYCSPCDGTETRTDTWLEAALPTLTGNVTGAWLYIDVLSDYSSNGTGTFATLYHASDASSATGNAEDMLNGNQFVQNITPAGSGWMAMDVTSFIESDYANGYNWAGFQFNPATSNPTESSFAFGNEAGGAAPYLQIATDAAVTEGGGAGAPTPEPATLALFGIGGGLACLIRRRRLQ
jgi:hypothetical protein